MQANRSLHSTSQKPQKRREGREVEGVEGKGEVQDPLPETERDLGEDEAVCWVV